MLKPYAVLRVAVPGVIQRVTKNEPNPDSAQGCHGVLIQVLPTNTGRVYIGTAALDRLTPAGILGFLAIPTANSIPSFQAALTLSPGAIQLRDIYIDTDVANDGVAISILVT